MNCSTDNGNTHDKSLTACVEGVDHRIYQEWFFSSPDLSDNPHTTTIKCHRTLKFKNLQGTIFATVNRNTTTMKRQSRCEHIVKPLFKTCWELQGSLNLSAAYEEDQTHKPGK
jgi:hypothetical protein